MAGQWDVVEAFRELDAAKEAGASKEELAELDIYTVTGKKMDMDRQGGKIGVLAGGYGGGRYAILAFSVGYGLKFTEDEAQAIVDAYRAANPLIVQMWKEEDDANKHAIRNPHTVIDRGRSGSVMFNGQHLLRKLPSGRCLCYRNAKIEKRETPWGQMRWTIVHDANFFAKGTRELYRSKMHGALSVQNVTQALCRDVLAVGMYRASKFYGLDIRLHVHDELGVATTTPHIAGVLLVKAMTSPIRWCEGLPIASSVDIIRRYRKT